MIFPLTICCIGITDSVIITGGKMITESQIRIGTTLTVENSVTVWLDENPIATPLCCATGEYNAQHGDTIEVVGHLRLAGVKLIELFYKGRSGQAYIADICASCQLVD